MQMRALLSILVLPAVSFWARGSKAQVTFSRAYCLNLYYDNSQLSNAICQA